MKIEYIIYCVAIYTILVTSIKWIVAKELNREDYLNIILLWLVSLSLLFISSLV